VRQSFADATEAMEGLRPLMSGQTIFLAPQCVGWGLIEQQMATIFKYWRHTGTDFMIVKIFLLKNSVRVGVFDSKRS
jgi:hypothetical protein